MKLSELRQLHDNRVLTEDEYEEQREKLVELMRQRTVRTRCDHKYAYMYPASLMLSCVCVYSGECKFDHFFWT